MSPWFPPPGGDLIAISDDGIQDGYWGKAVDLLTAVARRRRHRLDGVAESMDFADFLAAVLAAVAANVGGVERVLAGRPGSWEASLVRDLLVATVGDGDGLLFRRTAPIVVPLNVPALVDDWCASGGDPRMQMKPFYDAVEEIDEPEDGERPYGRLWDRYYDAYCEYADRFSEAVLAKARTIPGLMTTGPDGRPSTRVPVEVVAETNPEDPIGQPENPGWDEEEIIHELWNHAFRSVAPPSLPESAG